MPGDLNIDYGLISIHNHQSMGNLRNLGSDHHQILGRALRPLNQSVENRSEGGRGQCFASSRSRRLRHCFYYAKPLHKVKQISFLTISGATPNKALETMTVGHRRCNWMS